MDAEHAQCARIRQPRSEIHVTHELDRFAAQWLLGGALGDLWTSEQGYPHPQGGDDEAGHQ